MSRSPIKMTLLGLLAFVLCSGHLCTESRRQAAPGFSEAGLIGTMGCIGPPTAANTPPIADAGEDITVSPESLVQLNGLGSFDLDEDVLEYQWEQVQGPSSVTLDDASSAAPSFTPAAPGIYEFELTVLDPWGASDTDTVQVTVQQEP